MGTHDFMKFSLRGSLRKLAPSAVALYAAVLLTACHSHSKVEETYILKNDSGRQATVKDCFIAVVSRARFEYNEKHVLLSFRNDKSEPIINREFTYSASEIKPKVDWRQYPMVIVSLLSQEQQVDVTVTLDAGNVAKEPSF
jgi:hypothetical protein